MHSALNPLHVRGIGLINIICNSSSFSMFTFQHIRIIKTKTCHLVILVSGLPRLALVCSFGYIAFFSLGLGPVPWLMMGEVFPGKIRSSASSLAAGFNWTCSFITTETVPGQQIAGRCPPVPRISKVTLWGDL